MFNVSILKFVALVLSGFFTFAFALLGIFSLLLVGGLVGVFIYTLCFFLSTISLVLFLIRKTDSYED